MCLTLDSATSFCSSLLFYSIFFNLKPFFQSKASIFMVQTVNSSYLARIVVMSFFGTKKVKILFIWSKVMKKAWSIVSNPIQTCLSWPLPVWIIRSRSGLLPVKNLSRSHTLQKLWWRTLILDKECMITRPWEEADLFSRFSDKCNGWDFISSYHWSFGC